METESTPTIVDQIFELLEQVILPDWNDVIRLVPLLLLLGVVVFLIFNAWQWRRAAERTRPRVARPLAAGAPPPGIHLPGPSRWPFVVPVGVALMLLALALPARDENRVIVQPFNPLLLVIGLVVLAVAVVGWLRDAMREWRATVETSDSSAGLLAPGATPSTHMPAGAMEAHATPATSDLQPATSLEPPTGIHLPEPSPWPFFAPIAMTVIFFGLIFSPVLIVGGLLLAVIAAAGWLRDAGREYRSTEAVGHVVPVTRDPHKVWPRRLVPIFAVVIAVSLLVTLAPIGIAWVNTLAPAGPTASALAVPGQPEITARTAASFETTTLLVPCCRPFELVFHNEHAGVPHNVEIADSAARATVHLDGEVVTGVATTTYQVPALTEGDYYFLCAIHPNMNGTVQARPESGGPPGSGAPAGPPGSPGAP
jgi:hypothetical protein